MTIKNYIVTNYKTITLYIPILFGILAIIFCLITTLNCETIEFVPLENTNTTTNTTTRNYQLTLTDPNTNTDFIIQFPEVAPILTYGPWRQRAFIILSTNEEIGTNSSTTSDANTTTNIRITISNSYYKCTKTPMNITKYDSYWRYTKIISVIILIFGSGIVVAHSILLCINEAPTIRRWENISLAITFVLFGGFQASCIVFITDSIACNNYPPLQYQFPKSLERSIQSYNLTLNDNNSTKSDLMNGWMEYIQTTYPQICQPSSGRTWLIASSVIFMVTGITMILTGPLFIQRAPPTPPEEPNTSSYWATSTDIGLESSYLPTESRMTSNEVIITSNQGEINNDVEKENDNKKDEVKGG